MDELTHDRSAMSLEAVNRKVYRLLKEGIPASVAERDSTPQPGSLPGRGGEGASRTGNRGALGTARPTKGGQTTVRVRVIDWQQPANNDFLLGSQFSVTGALGSLIEKLRGVLRRGILAGDKATRPEHPLSGL